MSRTITRPTPYPTNQFVGFPQDRKLENKWEMVGCECIIKKLEE